MKKDRVYLDEEEDFELDKKFYDKRKTINRRNIRKLKTNVGLFAPKSSWDEKD
jgi:hypothetical protein